MRIERGNFIIDSIPHWEMFYTFPIVIVRVFITKEIKTTIMIFERNFTLQKVLRISVNVCVQCYLLKSKCNSIRIAIIRLLFAKLIVLGLQNQNEN